MKNSIFIVRIEAESEHLRDMIKDLTETQNADAYIAITHATQLLLYLKYLVNTLKDKK